MTKIKQAAIAAKEDGYRFMYSVVKQVYNTPYYHVVPIDDVITTGKWPAATRGRFPTADGQGSWYGPAGTRDLPCNAINKSFAISRYCR